MRLKYIEYYSFLEGYVWNAQKQLHSVYTEL